MQDLRVYQDLPPALAMRLAITVHRRILSRCPALCSLSDDALLGVLGRLKPRIYIPGQVIIIEGQEQRAILFVKKGAHGAARRVGRAAASPRPAACVPGPLRRLRPRPLSLATSRPCA